MSLRFSRYGRLMPARPQYAFYMPDMANAMLFWMKTPASAMIISLSPE
jgi:hypothetical protein